MIAGVVLVYHSLPVRCGANPAVRGRAGRGGQRLTLRTSHPA
jgi:hypothetical protein